MKHSFFLFFLFACCIPVSASADVVDRAVAIVNDDVITLSEVNELGEPYFAEAREKARPEELPRALEQIRASIIEQLIEKQLMLQEAQKNNLTISEQEVEQAFQRILDTNHITEKELSKELESTHLTLQGYKEGLHDQILSSKLVNYAVRSKVLIPDSQLEEYYNREYAQQGAGSGYYLLQIGIDWQHAGIAPEEARQNIEEAHAKALQGEDFSSLAREYSNLPSATDNGDLGLFQADEMAPYMRTPVMTLKPGEISTIVETPSTYQFFKLLSLQKGTITSQVPFAEVKEEIHEKLYQEELEKRYKDWLEGMKEKAYIRIL